MKNRLAYYIYKKILLSSIAVVIAFGSISLISSVASADAPNCDDNAVMRCGAFNYAELAQKYQQNQGGNTQALYALYGIRDASGLQGMVEGQVTSNNQVLINGQVVADHALTAGRQDIGTSTPILNGQFYQRSPSVSFASSSLRAFVMMRNNVFQYAVILACGNPVIATPTTTAPAPPPPAIPPQTHPSLSIEKAVSLDQKNWSSEINAKPGVHVFYRVLVKNTGDVTLSNLRFRDSLASSLEFISGSLTINGDSKSGNVTTSLATGSLDINQKITLEYQAVIDAKIATCGPTLMNTATVVTDQVPNQSASAIVHVCATPAPQSPVQPVSKPEAPIPAPKPAVQTSIPSTSSPSPTVLPNTGFGETAGIFGSTVSAGFLAHLIMRRLRRTYFL
ncbi:MAG: hypothetical protein NVS1B7_7590 [Candidatus Saccharimonadales bacterium]